jgi:long-chain fatty acid transport protein
VAVRCLITTIVSLLAAGSLYAQGASIHSHSGCALSRNSAGVAEPCNDGSAIYYNPAAIVRARGVASAGALAIFASDEFRFRGAGGSFAGTQPAQFAPHLWVTAPVTSKITAGLGAWAPYGLSTRWPTNFEGRFFGWDNTLRAIYLQPTVAAELMNGKLALGAGFVIANGFVELNRRLDLAQMLIPGTEVPFSALGVPEGTDFANADLEVDDWAFTFDLGAQYRLSDRWVIGARYLHSAGLDLSGSAHFEQIATGIRLPPNNPFGLPPGTPLDLLLATLFQQNGLLEPQRLTSELTMPSQAAIGASYSATSALKLFLDYQWTHWDQWDEAVLQFGTAPNDTLFLDFHDASTFRLGAEYTPRDQLMVRAGILHNRNAAPEVTNTPLLPEAPRTSFSGGVGYQFSQRFGVDAGIEYLIQDERPGVVLPRDNRQQPVSQLIVGDYTAHAWFLGLTLSYRFGKRAPVNDPTLEK